MKNKKQIEMESDETLIFEIIATSLIKDLTDIIRQNVRPEIMINHERRKLIRHLINLNNQADLDKLRENNVIFYCSNIKKDLFGANALFMKRWNSAN